MRYVHKKQKKCLQSFFIMNYFTKFNSSDSGGWVGRASFKYHRQIQVTDLDFYL